MRAGDLRHRVDILNYTETQDTTTGELVKSWGTLATVWAAIAPLSAKEFIAAQSTQSKILLRVTIRYRDDIKPNMRLYYAAKDKTFEIEGILSDKDSGLEYLTLPCSVVEDVG